MYVHPYTCCPHANPPPVPGLTDEEDGGQGEEEKRGGQGKTTVNATAAGTVDDDDDDDEDNSNGDGNEDQDPAIAKAKDIQHQIDMLQLTMQQLAQSKAKPKPIKLTYANGRRTLLINPCRLVHVNDIPYRQAFCCFAGQKHEEQVSTAKNTRKVA
jgi:hypothetical protein